MSVEEDQRLTADTIVATLRQVAGWIQDPDASMLRETANMVENIDLSDDYSLTFTCLMCQEVVCDTGCPLEQVRSRRRVTTP